MTIETVKRTAIVRKIKKWLRVNGWYDESEEIIIHDGKSAFEQGYLEHKGAAVWLAYDGGHMWSIMTGEYGFEGREKFTAWLQVQGYWFEDCNSWSCCVYKL